jgi:hypothetical protein
MRTSQQLKVQAFCDAALCQLVPSYRSFRELLTLKIKARYSSETPVTIYQWTPLNIPEGVRLQQNCLQNLDCGIPGSPSCQKGGGGAQHCCKLFC